MKDKISALKKQKNALIMAHYYQRDEIQEVADFIGDSLALAQQAARTDADIIVMCGVHFMGETAKILCPDKKVIVPDMTAGCSLADSCEAEEFARFVADHPDHTVISYVNTSAAVKAHTDIVVTSGNALKIVSALPEDEKIIFGPDRNLGSYINAVTGREMVLWPGACHVHDRFSFDGIMELKRQHPGAKVLVHPECRRPLQLIADKVGSTAALLAFCREDDAREYIVVTESGILREMRLKCPEKVFIPAPPDSAAETGKESAEVGAGCSTGDEDCKGCNHCEYMKLNTLEKVYEALKEEQPEIIISEELAARARRPIERMLAMS